MIACDLEYATTITPETLIFTMRHFITEIRKLDGSDYPPKTLYQIVLCVQFHLETLGFSWKIIDDDMFKEIRFTLDNVMKMRTVAGVGITVRKADIITKTDEDILWSKGVLGTDCPEQLLNTVLYVVGLNCALRAGKEHRKLRSIPFSSQFTFMHDDQGTRFIRYQEDIGLKTNKGVLKHRKLDPKIVDIYPINTKRCPVGIIEKYLSLLPTGRVTQAFYLQPLKFYYDTCWYQDSPVGINKLQKVVKVICERGGLPGYYTNHSLRAAAATRPYQENFDEQVIAEVTGHRSNVIRTYKRTCSGQRKSATYCLNSKVSDACDNSENASK